MLKAWCEVTFGGGVRRSIAPSREREFDEMCVDVGLVPNWRLMWDAWVPRGKGYTEAGTWALAWSTDQGERSRRVRTIARLFRCFRVWSASTREAGQRMAAYGYVCGSEGEDGAPPSAEDAHDEPGDGGSADGDGNGHGDCDGDDSKDYSDGWRWSCWWRAVATSATHLHTGTLAYY